MYVTKKDAEKVAVHQSELNKSPFRFIDATAIGTSRAGRNKHEII